MTDVVIKKYEACCKIDGNYPTKDILEATSTKNRNLADFQKKQRGWLESEDEMELLRQLWSHGHGRTTDIVFHGRTLTIDEAKSLLSARAQNNLAAVLMSPATTLNRTLGSCIDDNFSVFDHLEGTFPNGILPEVEKVLKSFCVEYAIEDCRTIPKIQYPDWGLDAKYAKLRPPQEAWDNIITQEEHGGMEWTVGTGKTLGLVLCITKHQVKTLFVVPGVDLLNQTVDKLLEYTNIPADMIGKTYGGEFCLRPITVTTTDTLESHLEEFKKFGFHQLLVDEAHTAGARGLYESIMNLACYYRYFASGTFYREDHPKRIYGQLDMIGENMLLKAVSKKILDSRSYQDGVKAGYLCQVTVECIEHGPEIEGCGYKPARERGIVNNNTRNENFAQRIAQHTKTGKTALGLVVETEHAEIMVSRLTALGVKAEMVTGKTKSGVRESILADLRNRKLDCVIGTSCIRTGVDIGTLDVVANIGGLKSHRSTIQGTGRGTRTGTLEDEAGFVKYIKAGATIIDSMDKHHAALGTHALARMLAYYKEGFDVPHLKEHFEEEADLQRRSKERALRNIREKRRQKVSKLPNLKKQLQDLEILMQDPDRNTSMTGPQIRKHIDRLKNEIASVETEARLIDRLETVEDDYNHDA